MKQKAKPSINTLHKTRNNAQDYIDNIPIPQLVAGINNLLSQLEKRRVQVYDWDNGERTLYRLQMRRGKVYYLADDQMKQTTENET